MTKFKSTFIAHARSRGYADNLKILRSAWDFAHLAHSGQKRLSGDPFINHPTIVAKTLIDWKLDTTTIVAGLLHDTIEDGGATRMDIVHDFSENVALLVDGVTKITNIRLKHSTQSEFAENLRKMLLVMAKDLRVVLIKLADRLHNMQTLQYLSPDRQLANSRETLEIYAPLAERLGIGEIKGQLEDLSFRYVYPREFDWLTTYSAPFYKSARRHIQKARNEILTTLSKTSLETFVVHARSKHLYSLYRKLLRPEIDRDINRIHDLSALRILVNSEDDCYIALGAIHRRFRPVPYLGVRDFVANPKPNGYKSIHTNVFGPEGKIVEVQIRTHQMHEEAEMGIAAHWSYAFQKSAGVSDSILESGKVEVPDKLGWVKQLVSWQKQVTDSEEFLDALKFDALQHRNLVFSPMGDVYDLPRGATPIDFAYAVHTKLGHQATGAKVNGRLVGLSHKLIQGDMVEIIVNRNKKFPSHDWLKFVVTTTARHEIAKSLKTA